MITWHPRWPICTDEDILHSPVVRIFQDRKRGIGVDKTSNATWSCNRGSKSGLVQQKS
jgi:hypothetical protein